MKNSTNLFNFEYLDQMAMGDHQIRRELLTLLPLELSESLNSLSTAVSNRDFEAIYQASHKLKSTLAFTGNHDALTLNGTIEGAARLKKDMSLILNTWTPLQALLQQLLEALHTIHQE